MLFKRWIVKTPEPVINRQILFATLLIISINILIHIPEFTVSSTATICVALVYRWWIYLKGKTLPRRWTLWLFLPVTFGSTFVHYQTITGQEAATHLLALLMCLKILETVKYRDIVISLFICLLLLASKLLVNQNFSMTLFLIADVILINSLLLLIHQNEFSGVSLKQILKSASKMLLQAAPLIVLLFFIFPRFNFGLWNLNNPPRANSGFDETMDPGEFTELVLSKKIAFRAKFDAEKSKTPANLYWRGIILTDVDGMKWTNRKSLPDKTMANGHLNPIQHEVEITLEPRFNQWIFTLDSPVDLQFGHWSKNARIKQEEGQVFKFRRPVSQRIRYVSKSSKTNNLKELPKTLQEIYLNKPEQTSSQLQNLIDAFLDGDPSENELVLRILNYFQNEGFRYTLNPPALNPENKFEDFVFNKKQGFCEHYAASFSLLMRHLGIPSRVVIGFLGGKYNEFDDYYIITDQDAHAWSEYWSQSEKRWIRVDPTGAIAPLRLTLNAEDFYNLDLAEMMQEQAPDGLFNLKGPLAKFFESSWLFIDAMANRWNLFLLNYDFNAQKKWLQKIGLEKNERFFLLVSSLLLLVIGYFTFKFRRTKRKANSDVLAQHYVEFCEKLEKKGLKSRSNLGPEEFLNSLIEQNHQFFKDNEKSITGVISTYKTLRYSIASASLDSARLRAFKKMAHSFEKMND